MLFRPNLNRCFHYYADEDQPPYTGQRLPRGVCFDAYTNKYVKSQLLLQSLFIAFFVIIFAVVMMLIAIAVING